MDDACACRSRDSNELLPQPVMSNSNPIQALDALGFRPNVATDIVRASCDGVVTHVYSIKILQPVGPYNEC